MGGNQPSILRVHWRRFAVFKIREEFFVLRHAAEIQKVTPRQKTRPPGFWVDENACEIFHKLSCIETAGLTSSTRFHFRRMQIADSKNVRSTENP